MKIKTNCHIKLGDTIKVIAGNNKGFVGKITSVILKKSIVYVEGITPRVKYIKNKQGGEPTKISLFIPIHISNVMLWDKSLNKSSKIGYKIQDNKKYRYFKKSGNLV